MQESRLRSALWRAELHDTPPVPEPSPVGGGGGRRPSSSAFFLFPLWNVSTLLHPMVLDLKLQHKLLFKTVTAAATTKSFGLIFPLYFSDFKIIWGSQSVSHVSYFLPAKGMFLRDVNLVTSMCLSSLLPLMVNQCLYSCLWRTLLEDTHTLEWHGVGFPQKVISI